MKTLKSIFAGVAFLCLCVTVNASVKPVTDEPTKTDVVNSYISAINQGKVNDLNKFVDSEVQFNLQRGETTNTLNKTQLFDSMRDGEGDPAITTTSKTISEDASNSTVQVDFKYEKFTRTDVIALTYNNGWKITSITSTYK